MERNALNFYLEYTQGTVNNTWIRYRHVQYAGAFFYVVTITVQLLIMTVYQKTPSLNDKIMRSALLNIHFDEFRQFGNLNFILHFEKQV